jgi:hypothetical protein
MRCAAAAAMAAAAATHVAAADVLVEEGKDEQQRQDSQRDGELEGPHLASPIRSELRPVLPPNHTKGGTQ